MAHGACVLLVESNEQDSVLIKHALLRLDCFARIETVGNALDAMNYLEGVGRYRDRERFPFPGTVLLGLGLPGIDGFEVLSWIRSQSALADLRVVVLVSPNSIRDASRSYQLGADSFLLKPADFEHLVSLKRALKSQRARPDSAAQAAPALAFG